VIIDPITILSQEDVSKCMIENVYFEFSEVMLNMPVNIKIKTTECANSVLRIQIFKKGLTDLLVSEQQALVNKNEISLLWISDKLGEFYVKVISENTKKSEPVKIIDFNVYQILEENKFYEVMSQVRQVSRSNVRIAIDICAAMPSVVERDACFEELAISSQNKNICSKIIEDNRRSSCKEVFVLYGDLGGCIESDNKAMCALVGLIAKDQDFIMYFSKPDNAANNEDIIMKKKLRTNSFWLIIIILLILCIIVFVAMELWNKKLHKTQKVRKRKNIRKKEK